VKFIVILEPEEIGYSVHCLVALAKVIAVRKLWLIFGKLSREF